ncbi:MAG: hypothetical protein AB1345_13735 [Chloroflexota bacterium]
MVDISTICILTIQHYLSFVKDFPLFVLLFSEYVTSLPDIFTPTPNHLPPPGFNP